MILFDAAANLQPIVEIVQQARVELRVQAEALPAPLRPALRDAAQRGVKVRFLLGPKAAYTLDDKGQPLVPSRMFLKGPQGADVEFAADIGSIYINPRFSEFGPDGAFSPGVRSHAFYFAAQTGAVLCTGAPTLTQRPLCATGDAGLARALASLFDSEFSESLTPAERTALLNTARGTVVVGPDDNAPLLTLLAVPGAVVLTSALDEGRAFAQLTRGAGKTLVVPPDLARAPAVAAARAAGVRVVTRGAPFEGTVVWTPGRAFLGSQRLTDAALARDRDVGVLLQGDGAEALRKFVEGRT